MLLHNAKKFDDDLGGRSEKDLSLSLSFGIDNAVESVIQDANSDHIERYAILLIPAGRVQEGKVSQTVPTSVILPKRTHDSNRRIIPLEPTSTQVVVGMSSYPVMYPHQLVLILLTSMSGETDMVVKF